MSNEAAALLARLTTATASVIVRASVRAGAMSEPNYQGHGASERFVFSDRSVLVVLPDGRYGLEGAKRWTLV